jgi:hypothetical protein
VPHTSQNRSSSHDEKALISQRTVQVIDIGLPDLKKRSSVNQPFCSLPGRGFESCARVFFLAFTSEAIFGHTHTSLASAVATEPPAVNGDTRGMNVACGDGNEGTGGEMVHRFSVLVQNDCESSKVLALLCLHVYRRWLYCSSRLLVRICWNNSMSVSCLT